MMICIDFDGTVVTHEFPEIGKDIGAVPVLQKLVKQGHQLILWTMRSDKKNVSGNDYNIHQRSGNYLSEAVKWFTDNNIELYGINENSTQKNWTESPKAYAEFYIDDACLFAPLVYVQDGRPHIDWVEVEKRLKKLKILV